MVSVVNSALRSIDSVRYFGFSSFDAAAKKLTYVTGMPSNIKSIGKTVYSQDGKVYIPVNVENEQPAIYAINTTTAQAAKGVTIEATDITGFGFLTPVK